MSTASQNYFIYAVSNNYPKRIPKDYLKGLTLLQLIAGNPDMVREMCKERFGIGYLAKSLGIVANANFQIIFSPQGTRDPNLIVLAIETSAKRLFDAAKTTEDFVAILPNVKAILYGYNEDVPASTNKPAHKQLYIPALCSSANIGAKLVTTATEYAINQGYDTIKLESMIQVIGFYYNLGFRFTCPHTEDCDFEELDAFRFIDDEFKEGGFHKITPKTIKEKYFSTQTTPPFPSQVNEKMVREFDDFINETLCEDVLDTSDSTYMSVNFGTVNMELFISEKMKKTPLYHTLFSDDVVSSTKKRFGTLKIKPSYSRLTSRPASTRRSSFHKNIKSWSKSLKTSKSLRKSTKKSIRRKKTTIS